MNHHNVEWTPHKVKSWWEAKAGIDSIRAQTPTPFSYKLIVQRIARHLGPGVRLLDVGFGTGQILQMLEPFPGEHLRRRRGGGELQTTLPGVQKGAAFPCQSELSPL